MREPMGCYKDDTLSKGARLLLVLLWRHLDDERPPGGGWYASAVKAELCLALGITRSSFKRYQAELFGSPWLLSTRRKELGRRSPVWIFELGT